MVSLEYIMVNHTFVNIILTAPLMKVVLKVLLFFSFIYDMKYFVIQTSTTLNSNLFHCFLFINFNVLIIIPKTENEYQKLILFLEVTSLYVKKLNYQDIDFSILLAYHILIEYFEVNHHVFEIRHFKAL